MYDVLEYLNYLGKNREKIIIIRKSFLNAISIEISKNKQKTV